MKTTIDIADSVLEQARSLAAEQGTTLKAVVEDALRQHLAARRRARGRFKLRDGTFHGDGLQPGIRWGDWETVRDVIYEGRGA